MTDQLDPMVALVAVVRSRLDRHPLWLEAWLDTRLVGLTAREAARREGVTPQCVSRRVRLADRLIAERLTA